MNCAGGLQSEYASRFNPRRFDFIMEGNPSGGGTKRKALQRQLDVKFDVLNEDVWEKDTLFCRTGRFATWRCCASEIGLGCARERP